MMLEYNLEAQRLRALLDQTLSREQKRELEDFLKAYRDDLRAEASYWKLRARTIEELHSFCKEGK
jgi:thiaminase